MAEGAGAECGAGELESEAGGGDSGDLNPAVSFLKKDMQNSFDAEAVAMELYRVFFCNQSVADRSILRLSADYPFLTHPTSALFPKLMMRAWQGNKAVRSRTQHTVHNKSSDSTQTPHGNSNLGPRTDS